MLAEIDATVPQFSIVIPVYNDWEPLEGCLLSLNNQTADSVFEVVIVDDGSKEAAPESIRQFGKRFPLMVDRQQHAGIAAARNRGVQNSRGGILVFTDADCRLDASCLSVLKAAASALPQQKYFQMRLAGDSSNLVGRAEELRLLAIQGKFLQSDGCIRYLNTSGFAIRRSAMNTEPPLLFNPSAQRSEDTLLLTRLVQRGELPFFVTGAVVRHTVNMSIARCIRKDVRVAWLEAKTFERIAATGVKVRMKNKERIALLRYMWKASRQPSIGRSAWFVVVARQAVQRAISLLYRGLPFRSEPQTAPDSP
jgi:glycosyltransferase involved in cell wall biosynthesis